MLNKNNSSLKKQKLDQHVSKPQEYESIEYDFTADDATSDVSKRFIKTF